MHIIHIIWGLKQKEETFKNLVLQNEKITLQTEFEAVAIKIYKPFLLRYATFISYLLLT